MINGFKLTKRLYTFVFMPIYFVIVIGMTILTDKVALSTVISTILLLISMLFLDFFARKKYNNKGSLLTVECDPEAYRDFLLEMLSKKIGKDAQMRVKLDLSYAYYHCGDFQQMRHFLDSVDFGYLKSKRKNILFEGLIFRYYDMWFFYFLKFEDIESAERVLKDIDDLFLSSEGMLRELNESAVRMKHLSLESRKQEIPDIEEKVEHDSEVDKMLYKDEIFYKVSNKNFLGNYYLRYGILDKAKDCFEFVVQNGNKLYMVKEAMSILEKLNKEN